MLAQQKQKLFQKSPFILSIIGLFFLMGTFVSSGQVDSKLNSKIKVGIYHSPPFVIADHVKPTGLAIELWEKIAERQELEFEYLEFTSFEDLVNAVEKGQIRVALSNITISKKRAQRIDFTQPWYDAGLRIMIAESKATTTSEVLNGLKEAGHIKAYLWLIGVILFFTIALTYFDRVYDKEFPKRWREGMAESFYTVMSVATSGNLKRKNLFGWRGKVFSAFWLVIGILILAYLTSSITSVMTTLSLSNEISSLEDLRDKKIGVLYKSITEDFVLENGYSYNNYKSLEEAVDALNRNEISAIIGDAPVLEYYDYKNPDKYVKVVGKLFEPDKYGFGVKVNDSIEKQLTIEILHAKENDIIEDLTRRYFGNVN